METITEKFNGNEITYKIVNGTAYHIDTPDEVVNIIDSALNNHRNTRLRFFYGNKETGEDSHDEYDTIGYVGRSTGRIKIPLLIKTRNSYGGGAILDNSILKITIDKKVVYQHPSYKLGELTIYNTSNKELINSGYTVSVDCNGKNIANFKNNLKAQNYVSFLKGERNRT